MKYIVGVILLTFALAVFSVRISKNIIFDKNVTGYLKRAADANTIDMAKAELNKAILYIEANNFTSGYTSIFYETPDEDLGFWYNNIKTSYHELNNLNSTSALEKTNVLIKLRETLTDSGNKVKVTKPKGIAVFPNNAFWAILVWLAFFTFIIGLVIILPKQTFQNPKSN